MEALVFAQEWAAVVALVEGLGGLAVLGGVYRLAQCHQTGCHRFGRFKHGHLRLCGIHHPLVPAAGVDADHIASVTREDVAHDERLRAAVTHLTTSHEDLLGELLHNGPRGQAEPVKEPPSDG